jgi:hypothetical protein
MNCIVSASKFNKHNNKFEYDLLEFNNLNYILHSKNIIQMAYEASWCQKRGRKEICLMF